MTDKDRGKQSHESVTRHEDGNPKGAGKSTTRRGEDVSRHEHEAGRKDQGTKGQSKRSVGASTARGSTGVDPQDPIDPKSPHVQRGGG